MKREMTARIAQRVFENYERRARLAVDRGVARRRIEDERLDGPIITLDGRQTVNFGSCSYLGLNLDPRLKTAAMDAVDRYGSIHSSSTVYTSIGLYDELEAGLSTIVGGHVVVTSTTTLAHLTALPVLVGPADLVLVDAQAHHSVRLATQVLASEGVPIELLPHGDLAALESAVERFSPDHQRVWYLADGVYSMYGDLAVIPEIHRLLETYENLHAYVDDAHGFSAIGRHGRGHVLENMPFHPRLVLAVSLVKSFGSGGGALAFPDCETADRVRLVGGPLTFGGPLQNAELGAGVASVRIHLSDEHAGLATRLDHQIGLVAATCRRLALPLVDTSHTPIWFVRVGKMDHMIEIARAMMDDGYYTNPSSFPAVPVGSAGIRFTHTLLNSDDQIVSMLERLAFHLDRVVGSRIEVVLDLRESERATRGTAAN